MKKLYFFLIALTALLTSCEKDSAPDGAVPVIPDVPVIEQKLTIISSKTESGYVYSCTSDIPNRSYCVWTITPTGAEVEQFTGYDRTLVTYNAEGNHLPINVELATYSDEDCKTRTGYGKITVPTNH